MKSINLITITLICILALNGNVTAQQQKATKLPMTADQVIKAIDKEVKLTNEQKIVLKRRANTIIENVKTKPQLVTDSTRVTLQTVLDSVLTIEQKEIMRLSKETRCGDAVKKHTGNNNSNN